MNELMLLSSEQRNREKSLPLCYLMLLGGHLGLHRFYLKRTATAVAQLCLFLLVVVTYIGMGAASIYEANWPFLACVILLVLSGLALTIWVIVDLFLIPRMVREWNSRAEQQILQEIEDIRRWKAAAQPR